MLIPNTLFRMGGSAVVLTNRTAERRRAKYQLQHITRVHLGADDDAYRCTSETGPDKEIRHVRTCVASCSTSPACAPWSRQGRKRVRISERTQGGSVFPRPLMESKTRVLPRRILGNRSDCGQAVIQATITWQSANNGPARVSMLRRCVYQHQDEGGTTGVALDRNLVHVASKSLQASFCLWVEAQMLGRPWSMTSCPTLNPVAAC